MEGTPRDPRTISSRNGISHQGLAMVGPATGPTGRVANRTTGRRARQTKEGSLSDVDSASIAIAGLLQNRKIEMIIDHDKRNLAHLLLEHSVQIVNLLLIAEPAEIFEDHHIAGFDGDHAFDEWINLGAGVGHGSI